MELESNWDNYLSFFHAFTNAKVNKNFNEIYEEFEDSWFFIRRCTSNHISYLMRKNSTPKDEAKDPEDDYVTLDQQIIQRATIFPSC